MGLRGPPRLHSDELRRRGSTRWRQRRDEERAEAIIESGAALPDRERDLPEMPDWLSDDALRIWKVGAWFLAPMPSVDEDLLAMYAIAASDVVAMTKQVRKDGLTVKSPKHGGTVKHPLLGVINQTRGMVVRMANELGFSPSARKRLEWTVNFDDDQAKDEPGVGPEPPDEFDKFMAEKPQRRKA